jgi:hypothetical protein
MTALGTSHDCSICPFEMHITHERQKSTNKKISKYYIIIYLRGKAQWMLWRSVPAEK